MINCIACVTNKCFKKKTFSLAITHLCLALIPTLTIAKSKSCAERHSTEEEILLTLQINWLWQGAVCTLPFKNKFVRFVVLAKSKLWQDSLTYSWKCKHQLHGRQCQLLLFCTWKFVLTPAQLSLVAAHPYLTSLDDEIWLIIESQFDLWTL